MSRYDGQNWITFTITDGLAANMVYSISQDREGHLWFGTWRGGVSRYDGKTFTTFTTQDGLAHNRLLQSIIQDWEGHLWLGTEGGVSRYDGKTFTTFTTQDGLASNVMFISQDWQGNLWFSTHSRGVSRYDGKTFTTFTTQDGLAYDEMRSVLQDQEGYLWFGTFGGGVSRYDGKIWTTFTTEDGLAYNGVHSVFQDRKGNLWFGTWGGGVSRYDGQTWITFTTDDGLAHNVVTSIFQDRKGHLWFGTQGGVSRHDGQVFQRLTQQDGLPSNSVWSIFQDQDEYIWIGTANGVIRFRQPVPSPPPVFIDAVVADRRYEGAVEIEVPSFVKLTAFEFHGMSFKTRPEQMVYRYRLKGYEEAWRNTRERRVEYQDIPVGNYTFEVVAVDRDLVYSEQPATVRLKIVQDTRDEQIDELERRVRERTQALEEANKRLFQTNLELEEANRQVQEATERKSRFLASMSHELRTPMNAIMGFTNLVLRRSGDVLPERQRENLVKVKQASDHLLNLINDILDLSKIEAGRVDVKPVTFNVKALIAGCCTTVSPLVRPGVALNYEVADDLGEAHTDEARLRQIVINLLSNALKFTEKGEVRVSVRPSPRLASLGFPSPINGRGVDRAAGRGEGLSPSEGSLEDKTLEIAVSDTGVGIPSDALGLIFDEFRQVEGGHQKQKGTGLGLSITKKLTELLGGAIGVESEVGKGSTFTIRIPVVYKGD